MSHSLKNALKLSALGLSVGILAGCAADGHQEEMEQKIERAQSTADEALAVADENSVDVREALGLARALENDVDRNTRRISELNEKIDRMFEESMQK